MSRLPEIRAREQLHENGRHNWGVISGSRSRVIVPFALLLNSPETAGRIAHLGTYLRFESSLPGADRELAILATAREFDGGFQWPGHVRLALEEGLRQEVIDCVAHHLPVEGLTEQEALVINYCRELYREHRVSDSTFEAARARYGDKGVAELTALMGLLFVDGECQQRVRRTAVPRWGDTSPLRLDPTCGDSQWRAAPAP